MGMYAYLVAVSAADLDEIASWSAERIVELLDGPDAAYIDKAWQAAFPLIGSIAGTGELLTEEPVPVGDDLGFGPALFVDVEQVAAISARLTAADDATVEAHWEALDSPLLLMGDWRGPDGEEFALQGYATTVALFAAAAAASQGVPVAIM